MAMHRTWMWTAAALGLMAGVTVLLVVEGRAGAHAVPPAGTGPAAPAAADGPRAVYLGGPTTAGPVGQVSNLPEKQAGCKPAPQSGPVAPRDPQTNLLRPVPAEPDAGGERGRRVTAARWPLPLETPAPALAEGAAAEAVRPMPAPAAAPRPQPRSRPRPLPVTGTYPARLDGGGVLSLPADLRQQFKGQAGHVLYVTPGPDACLYLYTADGLREWGERLEQAAGSAARRRGARRLSLAQTEVCAVDHAGRLRLPERLTRFAGLRQDVVLLGGGDHLEAWDAGRWRQYAQHPDPAAAEEACEP